MNQCLLEFVGDHREGGGQGDGDEQSARRDRVDGRVAVVFAAAVADVSRDAPDVVAFAFVRVPLVMLKQSRITTDCPARQHRTTCHVRRWN